MPALEDDLLLLLYKQVPTMQTSHTASTLSRQPALLSVTTEGYETFFARLMDIVRHQPIDQALGQLIQSYVTDWLASHTLEDFATTSTTSYVRNYLGRCPETHWEAILMSWQQGNTTAIHSHPQFAGYFFADGVFEVEIFEPVGAHKARLTKRVRVNEPAAFFAIGDAERFDNHIHRITCLSDRGHSLHVYSDDALQGKTYLISE